MSSTSSDRIVPFRAISLSPAPDLSGGRPNSQPAVKPEIFFRSLAVLIILACASLRIAYLSSPRALDLAPDEAHYWDWSRHPDWSYYSKGPMVALLIGGSCHLTESWTQSLLGNAMLSVRLPAILCGSLLLVSFYVLTALVYRREGLALGVVALAVVALPPIAAASTIMTIDSPFLCCWSWALVFGHLALFGQRRWAWPAAGLMVALGILTKQTMVLWVPSLMLFLFFTPGWRHYLVRPGFWVLTLVGALGSVPILIWNYQNDWVTMKHLFGHTGLKEPLQWLGPLRYVGTQFALLLGYWFAVWATAMWAYRPWRSLPTALPADKPNDHSMQYLWWMSAPTFLFFLAFSVKNGGGEPNWPVTAYLSGMVLAADWLAGHLQHPRPSHRWASRLGLLAISSVGLALTVLVHDCSIAYPLLSTFCGPATAQNETPIRRLDPTCRLLGWRTLAAAVDEVRAKLQAEGIEPILAADRWSMPGELGFYCQGHPTVYSFGPLYGERHSQYDLWRPNPLEDGEQFRGRTFIFVSDYLEPIRGSFEQIEEGHKVIHYQRGQPVGRWYINVARDYRGPPAVSARSNY